MCDKHIKFYDINHLHFMRMSLIFVCTSSAIGDGGNCTLLRVLYARDAAAAASSIRTQYIRIDTQCITHCAEHFRKQTTDRTNRANNQKTWSHRPYNESGYKKIIFYEVSDIVLICIVKVDHFHCVKWYHDIRRPAEESLSHESDMIFIVMSMTKDAKIATSDERKSQ